jgi:hypothetical protein
VLRALTDSPVSLVPPTSATQTSAPIVVAPTWALAPTVRVDRCVAADRCAVVDRCAAVDRYVAVDRYAAAGCCVESPHVVAAPDAAADHGAAAVRIEASLHVAAVRIVVTPSGVQVVAQNEVEDRSALADRHVEIDRHVEVARAGVTPHGVQFGVRSVARIGFQFLFSQSRAADYLRSHAAALRFAVRLSFSFHRQVAKQHRTAAFQPQAPSHLAASQPLASQLLACSFVA